jgi:predicted amidohydrolase
MIVAGLQLDIAWEDPPENFARVEHLALPAVQAGAHLLVLPEMFATGFSMASERVSNHAQEIQNFLAGLSRLHGVWVLGGYAKPGKPRPHNVCALFDPQGNQALLYHKIHPFSLANEPKYYAAGNVLATHVVGDVRVTPLICYDLRFPEVFRVTADNTDLYLVIASWPAARIEAWQLLLRARAVENQAFVLGVNRVGDGDGLHYSGNSALIDPMGQEKSAALEQPTMILGEVNPEAVATCRRRFSFLADKKFKLYTTFYKGPKE